MRAFRIFISSPGDLGEERIICGRVVDRLKGEFARVARLQAILWEQEPLTADLDFQEQIPLPSQTDIVVLLLWSRLGYRLHSRFKAASDVEAPTGTIFEFRDAINARRANPARVPDVMVYRKTAEPPKPSINDPDKYLRALDEWRRVEAFFSSDFFLDAEQGAFTGAFHTFKRAGEFEENFERHLRAMIVRRLGENQSAGPAWTRGSPFRGLEKFDFEHGDLFAGRAQAVAAVIDALRQRAAAGCAFVLITGMSGGGKSSLARAGVLPDLTQPGVIEGIGLWRRAFMQPAESRGDLFRGLADALLPAGASAGDGTGLPELADDEGSGSPNPAEAAREQLAARLRQHPAASALIVEGALRQVAEAARAHERQTLLARRHELAATGHAEEAAELDRQAAAIKLPQARLAIVIDQMEELFTDTRVDAPAREAFLVALDALARGGRVWIIATLRSDFFAHCEANPLLVALKEGSGTYHLLPPTGAEISRMIRHPATAAGLEFERDARTRESLADVLLTATARDPGALPLLEFTLDELYKRAAAGDRQILSRADYEALGGLEGALATRAESVFTDIAAQNPRAEAVLPSVFGALARLAPRTAVDASSDSVAVVSQTAPLERFDGAAAELVRAMIDARLLVSDRGQVRVAHEALFRHWRRAREWIAENQDFLHARVRVAEAAQRWRLEHENEDFLLPRGKPLAEGEDLLARRREELSAEEIAFVEASSATRRRQQIADARRRRRVLTAISSALVLALIFAAISLWLYRRAETSARNAKYARGEAERLVEFMGVNLRDKLSPIGRLDLLDSANQQVRSYYESFAAQGGDLSDANTLVNQSTALINQGQILKMRGDPAGALKLLRNAQEIRAGLFAKAPANTARASDLAYSIDRIGDLLYSQHDLAGALTAFRDSFAIHKKLVALHPDDRRQQRDLGASMSRVADVLAGQGDLPGALKSYRDALAIHEENIRREPDNKLYEQDVYNTSCDVGNTLLTQGDAAGALAAFKKGVAVQRHLCDQEPRNLPWQRDLAVGLEGVANALASQGDNAAALTAYREAFAIHRKLAAFDPTNADWQRDLFTVTLQVGDTLLAQDDAAAALQEYSDALEIQSGLLRGSPENAEWQRNIAVADERMGKALEARKDFDGALAAYKSTLDVRRQLLERTPGDAGLKQELFVSLCCIADTEVALGRPRDALVNYRAALVHENELTAIDPTNAEWQRGLAEIEDKAADILQNQSPSAPEALDLYRRANAIYEKFSSEQPADSPTRASWAMTLSHLGQALAQQRPVPPEARTLLVKSRDLYADLQKRKSALDPRQTAAMNAGQAALAKLPSGG